MKNLFLTLLTVFILSVSNAFAEKDSAFIERAELNYLNALNHDVIMLVESAIFNVMVLKQRYPEFEYEKIVDKLNDLTNESDNPSVRYKAFLASNYIQRTNWFQMESFLNSQDTDAVYRAISNKLLTDEVLAVSSK